MNKTGTALPKNAHKFSVQKIESTYIASLEQLVKVLSEIVKTLCDEDSIENSSINVLNQLSNQLKYTERMKSQEEQSIGLSKYVQQALLSLKGKNEQFPKIRQMKSQKNSELATIVEKYSQENILSNYLRKNSHQKSNKYNNLSELEHYSESIHLGSEVNRQQTRRSLDGSVQKNQKPIYKELERMKTKDQEVGYRVYQQPKKFSIKSKLPHYTISKLI